MNIDTYELGSAEWDTGFCSCCHILMSQEDQLTAVKNILVLGLHYECHECFQKIAREWYDYIDTMPGGINVY